MKRYLIVLLLFFLSVGAASANTSYDDVLDDFDSLDVKINVDYFDADTNVTVGDYEFTIPQGFGIIYPLSFEMRSNDGSEIVNFFTNDNDDILMVSITSSDSVNGTISSYVPNETSYENVTIKNHDGAKWKADSYSFFGYIEDDDLIVLQAPDDSYFEEMIL